MRQGWTIRCHPGASQAFAFERDEPALRAELEGFLGACAPGMTLFDIGSHYGLFALAALHACGGSATVIAADPSASAMRVFDANMRFAEAGGRVSRRLAAITDHDGELPMLEGGAGAWHMMTTPVEPRPDARRLPALTLTTLSAQTGLIPTHVKIDVEGEEDAVLRGGAALLSAHHPVVFLELHGAILRRAGRSPGAVLERLVSLGYRTFAIAGASVDASTAAALDVARLICRA